MDIRKLQRAIVNGLEDVKAQDIRVFNTEHLSPLFERVIIASGTSNRQTKALAGGVRDAVKKAGFPVVSTEGEDNGEWIIVDCGAAVAHILQPAIRDYYNLEEIWGDKPVKLKVGASTKGLVKASEPMPLEGGEPVPAKKAPRRKANAERDASPIAGEPPVLPKPAARRGAKATEAGPASAAPARAKPAPSRSAPGRPLAKRAGSAKPAPEAAGRGRASGAGRRGKAAEAVQTIVVPPPKPAKAPARKAADGRAPARRPAAKGAAAKGTSAKRAPAKAAAGKRPAAKRSAPR